MGEIAPKGISEKDFFYRTRDDGLLECVHLLTGKVLAVTRDREVLANLIDQVEELEDQSGNKVLVQRGIDVSKLDTQGYTYNELTQDLIASEVAKGATLYKISQRPDMPCYDTLRRWKKVHPEFKRAIDEAMEAQSEMHFTEAMDAHKEVVDKEDVPVAKFKADNHKWAAAKLNPEQYGEKTKISGDKNAPLTLQVLTGVPRKEDVAESKEEKVEASEQESETKELGMDVGHSDD